jgi:hypothetical protein
MFNPKDCSPATCSEFRLAVFHLVAEMPSRAIEPASQLRPRTAAWPNTAAAANGRRIATPFLLPTISLTPLVSIAIFPVAGGRSPDSVGRISDSASSGQIVLLSDNGCNEFNLVLFPPFRLPEAGRIIQSSDVRDHDQKARAAVTAASRFS